MCLVVFSYEKDGSFTLAGNRDEFYNRETKAAGFWEDIPGLIAGKDMKAGGTWLGIDQQGNIAFLTNYRDPLYFKEAERSRGELLTKFFQNPEIIKEFSEFLQQNAESYNGYNLVFGNPKNEIFYYSNVNNVLSKVEHGIHGLSNAFFNTLWPKLEKTKNRFEEALTKEAETEEFLNILADTEPAPDPELPDTGINKEMEKKLSSPFIIMDGYGTRSSSFIQINKNGEAQFVERSYNGSPESYKDNIFRFLV